MSQIEDIVAGYRVLAAHGIIDAYGHVSVRLESDPQKYLLARSVAPARNACLQRPVATSPRPHPRLLTHKIPRRQSI